MSRRTLIAANWKMNKTIREAEAFADGLKQKLAGLPDCDTAIYPPFFALPAVARILGETEVLLGAQDVYWEKDGAFTGEISCGMVRDAGGAHVVVGHSERRHVLGEDNSIVARKLQAVVNGGLTAVFCVGEKIETREANEQDAFVEQQLTSALAELDSQLMTRVVIAYEPVWAIGTGKTATPEDADAMHQFIRHYLEKNFEKDVAESTRILYGGSVKPSNATELLARSDIDGALIGGASLELDSFLAIAQASGG